MFAKLFEEPRIPKIISTIIFIISVVIICSLDTEVYVAKEFKSSYLTILSILTGFLFSAIIFVNDQLAQLRYCRITDDAIKQSSIRYAKFYGRLNHRLVVAIFLAILLMITLLVSYCNMSKFFGEKAQSAILWGSKLILCCSSLYFWILTCIIFKGIFSFITHRKSETINWLYSLKFDNSHHSVNQ